MLELLPRGAFRIATADYGTLEGRFGTWALKRFTDKCFNGSLKSLFDAMQEGLSIDLMADLLLCGLEYAAVKEGGNFTLTHMDAYEIIDDAGGFTAFARLVNHAFGTDEEEKKKVQPPAQQQSNVGGATEAGLYSGPDAGAVL